MSIANRFLTKKSKGTAGVMDFLPVILMIIISAYVLLNCWNHMQYIDILNKLENLSKKYILIMETENGLRSDELKNLNEAINKLGIENEDISYEGTSFWDGNIDYGDDIYLYIRAQIPYNSLDLTSNLSGINKIQKKEVVISKCAIALS